MEYNDGNFQKNLKIEHNERPLKKRIRSGANARERDRTQSVNSAFDVLRTMIPIDPPDRKLSKIETLQLATKYINHLFRILNSEFGSSVFLIDQLVLFCKLCDVRVSAEKHFTVMQYLKTEKHIKSFLQEYTGKEISKEVTLRKGYVDDCYQDTLDKIRNYVSNNKILVSIDDMTDVVKTIKL